MKTIIIIFFFILGLFIVGCEEPIIIQEDLDIDKMEFPSETVKIIDPDSTCFKCHINITYHMGVHMGLHMENINKD